MTENELATRILDFCFEIHRKMGSGLLESVYAAALQFELRASGIRFARELPVSVKYKGEDLGLGFRADFVIDNKLIVELKSVESVNNAHLKQLLTYLRIMDLRLGLLINFKESLLRDGITRVANKL